MKWCVMVELIVSDGSLRFHEVSSGGSNARECSAATVSRKRAPIVREYSTLRLRHWGWPAAAQESAVKPCAKASRCSGFSFSRQVNDIGWTRPWSTAYHLPLLAFRSQCER